MVSTFAKGLKEKRAEAAFPKESEATVRKQRDGDKVELDCLPSRGLAMGIIIFKYDMRELRADGEGEREERRRMPSRGDVDDGQWCPKYKEVTESLQSPKNRGRE